jgi:hypothetical protein
MSHISSEDLLHFKRPEEALGLGVLIQVTGSRPADVRICLLEEGEFIPIRL